MISVIIQITLQVPSSSSAFQKAPVSFTIRSLTIGSWPTRLTVNLNVNEFSENQTALAMLSVQNYSHRRSRIISQPLAATHLTLISNPWLTLSSMIGTTGNLREARQLERRDLRTYLKQRQLFIQMIGRPRSESVAQLSITLSAHRNIATSLMIDPYQGLVTISLTQRKQLRPTWGIQCAPRQIKNVSGIIFFLSY